MTVLVVGGAGYIGSHVNKGLHARGIRTVVLDDLSRGFREAVKWGRFVEGNCADGALLDRIFQEEPIDAVMHFAAFAYVGESVEKPDLYYRNNVVHTLSLLDAMVRNGVKNLVFSSTCATFGEAVSLPIDENHPQVPLNPYGRSKLMVERILKDYDAAFGLRSCVFRYFNAAGCDPDGEIGENHDPETHVIPLILQALSGRRQDFSVFGTDYPTKDGTCIRDYVHVTDLAQAHCLGLENLLRNGRSDEFNLGNGLGFSVQNLLDRAQAVTGRNLRVRYEPRRPGDPSALVGASDKAFRVLGWKPEYASLDTILKTSWDWETRRSGSKEERIGSLD